MEKLANILKEMVLKDFLSLELEAVFIKIKNHELLT